MAGENLKAEDKGAVGIARQDGLNEVLGAPQMKGDFVCYEPGPDGTPQVKWVAHQPGNVVVNQGRVHLWNVVFGADRASTNGPFIFLHNATLGSGNVFSGISASVLTSLACGATTTNFATFAAATTYKNASDTGIASFSGSQSWVVSNGPQTVSGAGLMFYTSASMATNAATGDIRLYCYGSFTGTQQVVANNTISATVTLSYA